MSVDAQAVRVSTVPRVLARWTRTRATVRLDSLDLPVRLVYSELFCHNHRNSALHVCSQLTQRFFVEHRQD